MWWAVADGDGSIPIVSLGYMCASGWRRSKRLNPGASPITIREFSHRAMNLWGGGLQDGPASGDHVNIMVGRCRLTLSIPR